MMTPRENALAILAHEQPDYYGDFMDALVNIPDPVLIRDKIPQDGEEHTDAWGTVKKFPVGAPGAHPFITEENVVIKDIEHWQDELTVPTLDGLDWTFTEQKAAEVDRDRYFVSFLCAAGLFERSHFLLGMEDAFCDYLEYPDEMKALLRVIADYKIEQIELVAEHIHPDVIFYQDDWGSKQNLFLPPQVWRDIIKPLQAEISETIHGCGIMYMHHADCICEPIVEDMLDLGIDLWQGVIAQNDIVSIQERTRGMLAMSGGIDGPAVDVESITEEEIRAEVRRAVDAYCPAGRFFPAIPNGRCFREWNDGIVKDELENYGRRWACEHPVR